ncbi:MAG: DUF2520 domain-containing protein [Marinilabiliaceae bacterium]|nr:DUF2520 domain-containing protein [Marinilabiliaceae bacterium]
MKISLIGSGNVATHLATELFKKGNQIFQIYSKTKQNAENLAKKTNAQYIGAINELSNNADLIIISVNDQQVSLISEQIQTINPIIVHTTGSISIDILNKFPNRGVFYPFQTFSKNKPIQFSSIPFLIEANNKYVTDTLISLALTMSNNVQYANSQQRLYLHIAAVMSCNFVNHLYALSSNILSEQNLDFNLLKPLIKETTEKIEQLTPRKAQTGPAVRNDLYTINKHIEILKSKPDIKKIYATLTNNIIKMYGNK